MEAAAQNGISPQQFVQNAVSKTLENGAAYLGFVQEGIEAADRGELIEHDEAVRQIHQLFQTF